MKKFENGKYVDLTESEICFEEDFILVYFKYHPYWM